MMNYGENDTDEKDQDQRDEQRPPTPPDVPDEQNTPIRDPEKEPKKKIITK